MISDNTSMLPEPTKPASARQLVRVLHVINGEDYGGAERVQDILGLRLPEFGYDVTFLCVKPNRFAAVRRCTNVSLLTCPMRNRFDLRPVRRVARIIRQGEYALVHTHSPRSLLIGRPAAALCRVPLVHHVQCPALVDTSNIWRNRMNAFLERRLLNRVAAVIPVSESLRFYLCQQGIQERQLTVIPNAVPVLGPLSGRPCPAGIWTIGICALFRPRKGVEVLVRALAELKRDGFPVRLRAVGYFMDGPYERYIKNLVTDLGLEHDVQWMGFCDNVYDQLREMDLFVYPSTHGEGLPLAILEAMAAGVPVVSTNVEGTPEAVRDGTDGVIVEPNSVAALADGFRRILRGDLDWSALRVSAHRRQAERYSDTKLTRDVASVYDSVLHSR